MFALILNRSYPYRSVAIVAVDETTTVDDFETVQRTGFDDIARDYRTNKFCKLASFKPFKQGTDYNFL